MSRLGKIRSLTLIASTVLLLAAPFTLAFAEVGIETYISVQKPTEIVWSGTRLIAASEEEDGIIKLYSINPKDNSIERFAPTFAGNTEVHVVVSPGLRFPERYVYASSGDTINEIDTSGNTVRVFSTPSQGANITGLNFDYGGYFTNNLIATTHEGSIWSIDSVGKAQLITKLEGGLIPSGVFVAPDEYGPFSGHLIVSIRNQQKLVAISHKDYTVNTLVELPGESPGRLIYVSSRSDLYLTKLDEGSVVKIGKDAFYPDHIAGLLVLTEDGQGSGSIFTVHSNKTMVTVLKLVSDIKPPFKGSIFVFEQDFADAVAGKFEEKGVEINPLLWVIPIAVVVVAASFAVFWKYRGM